MATAGNVSSVADLLRQAATVLDTQRPQQSTESRAAIIARSSVQSEISRLFAPYTRNQNPNPRPRILPRAIKKKPYAHKFCCLAGRRDQLVPKPLEKIKLEQAGLGERRVFFPDRYCSAEEFEAHLMQHYVKLKDGGGYQLLKPYGATRSKTLLLIPCPVEGYTLRYLEATGIQSATIYVRPLQRDLSMEKNTLVESGESGPMINCIYCAEIFCHADIQEHVDHCNMAEVSRGSSQDTVPPPSDDGGNSGDEGGSSGRSSSLSASKSSMDSNDVDFEPTSAEEFCRKILQRSENEPDLVAKLDLTKDIQYREMELLKFYKANGVNWARPFSVIMRGDAAIGDGVVRHFLSFAMSKVQFGFDLNLDNSGGRTLFFTGKEDHLVPSTSRILLESDLFRDIGHMIGHSFIHGGPLLTGLSQSLFGLLTGDVEHHVNVDLEDIADTDIIEMVSVLQDTREMTEAEREQVNTIGLGWDIPPVTEKNRTWIAQCILHDAVIRRSEKQIQHLKKGLKDTGVLQLIEENPALVGKLFPRTTSQTIEPEMILDRTVWPEPDSDDEMDYPLEDSCRVTGFLRRYIDHASSDELKHLLQFWVGWATLPQHLYVEVSTSVLMPTAFTCREMLRLPLRYHNYEEFKTDLEAAVSSIDYGFGLI